MEGLDIELIILDSQRIGISEFIRKFRFHWRHKESLVICCNGVAVGVFLPRHVVEKWLTTL